MLSNLIDNIGNSIMHYIVKPGFMVLITTVIIIVVVGLIIEKKRESNKRN